MIGVIIATLIVLFAFYDVLTTIKWTRRQREQDKLLLMMTLATTIVLLMSEYIIWLMGK